MRMLECGCSTVGVPKSIFTFFDFLHEIIVDVDLYMGLIKNNI